MRRRPRGPSPSSDVASRNLRRLGAGLDDGCYDKIGAATEASGSRVGSGWQDPDRLDAARSEKNLTMWTLTDVLINEYSVTGN